MPVAFRLVPSRNLIVVTFSGLAGLAETLAGAREIAGSPGYRAHMNHLVDLRPIMGWERDFPGFMALQAQLGDIFAWHRSGAIIVGIAPHAAAQEMSGLVLRSWTGVEGMPVLRIVTDEEQALSLLGLRERSLAEVNGVAG